MAVLYPRFKMPELEGLNPIEYLVKHYEFNPAVLERLGEIGTPYESFMETLFTEIDSLCQDDRKKDLE
jgi:hypothetical protein